MASGLRNLAKIWQPVIGLEIHAQLATKSKLFSGSGTSFLAAANTQVSHFDAAIPGTLPILNRSCVELGVRVALALNADINLVSQFDRKHYFYADLPAGFQITQQRRALATGGHMRFLWKQAQSSPVRQSEAAIVQVQLEQDSGKSLHDPQRDCSYIDLNRAGTGLVEIVTAPNFACGPSAAGFVFELRALLMAIGACRGNMSKGELRVDANISVHRPGEPLGVRSEVKNLNSLRAVRRAIDFEIERQVALLESGRPVVNETRSYDLDTETTLPMRDKEKLQDYRYCPEPNLPPLRLQAACATPSEACSCRDTVCVTCVQRSMPQDLPTAQRQWLSQELGASIEQADTLLSQDGFFDFLIATLNSAGHDLTLRDAVYGEAAVLGREALYWLTGHVLGDLRKAGVDQLEEVLSPGDLATVAQRRLQGGWSQAAAKAALSGLMRGEALPEMTAAGHETVRRVCEAVLREEEGVLAQFRAGKKKAARFLLRKACEREPGLDKQAVAAEMAALLEREAPGLLSSKELLKMLRQLKGGPR